MCWATRKQLWDVEERAKRRREKVKIKIIMFLKPGNKDLFNDTFCN